jgi:hypothetical protein
MFHDRVNIDRVAGSRLWYFRGLGIGEIVSMRVYIRHVLQRRTKIVEDDRWGSEVGDRVMLHPLHF